MKSGFRAPAAEIRAGVIESDSRKAEMYQWLLGQKSVGERASHPGIQIEAHRDEPNLLEVARLIRGDGKSV